MAEHTLFGPGEAASGYLDNDTDTPMILGIVFKVTEVGAESVGLRFVPTSLVYDRHAYLWELNPSGAHTLLAETPIVDPEELSWSRADWDDPVPLDETKLYAVAVYHEHGGYYAKQGVFTTDLESATYEELVGPSSGNVDTAIGESGAGNGFYQVPSGALADPADPPALDLSTFNSSAYLIDPIVDAPEAPPSAPVNTSLPTISGNASLGSTMFCNPGAWSGVPDPDFTYQWRKDGSNIVGATSASYSPDEEDLGSEVSCRVTATNSQGTAFADTDAVQITLGMRRTRLSMKVGDAWQEVLPRSSDATLLYETEAGVGGLSEFDTGTIDLGPYDKVEIVGRLRCDNNSIYNEPLFLFNGDEDETHYHQQTEGGNPHTPGGHFSVSRWAGFAWNGSTKGSAVPAGLLLGYATALQAQSGYWSEWTAKLYRPGEAYLPKIAISECAFLEDRTDDHERILNGPELYHVSGFWTPDTAQAIERIQLYPAFGGLFVEGSRMQIIGYRKPF